MSKNIIPFVNNKGEEILLDGDMTLQDMVRLGIKDFRLVEKGTPLPDGWYKSVDPEEGGD